MNRLIIIGLLGGALLLLTSCIPLIVGAVNHQKKVRIQNKIAKIKVEQDCEN